MNIKRIKLQVVYIH